MPLARRRSKEKLYQLGRDIPEIKLKRTVAELQHTVTECVDEKLQRPVAEFPLAFALVPWGQHIDIVAKCKTIDEALFYIRETIEKGLSRPALLNCIKAKLYEHKGKILNNFSEHLPALQSELIQEVLKARPFEPEYAGKLNFYVNAVDDLLKQDDDNPTIGLLICSDMNKADVQWSFRGISTPMGVATYNNVRIKDMLPTQEQLRERMELLQRELRETKRLMGKS